MKDKISITIEQKLISEVDDLVDGIYIRNRSAAIEHLISKSLGERKVAVILSGGSPNSLEISKDVYRPTALIESKSVIEKAVIKLRESGFKEIHIIASKVVLTKIFEILKDGLEFNVKISYAEEQNSKGTAESLRLLKGKLNSRFLVVYGDILFSNINLEKLWKQHTQSKAVCTLLLSTSNKISQKGVVKMEGVSILDFIQKPKIASEYLVFSAIFASETDILDVAGSSLEYDVFPNLAKRKLLEGYLTPNSEKHIHSTKDLK